MQPGVNAVAAHINIEDGDAWQCGAGLGEIGCNSPRRQGGAFPDSSLGNPKANDSVG